MSAEHLILAGIFAFLFVAPLVWLFVIDGPRATALDIKLDPGGDDTPATLPPLEPR